MCTQERKAQGWEVSWKGFLAWPLLRDRVPDREGTASPLQDAGAWLFFVIKGTLHLGQAWMTHSPSA